MELDTTYNKIDAFWHGPQVDLLYEPQITIGDIVFQALRENPTRNCQV